ncbi:hypothetical protein KEM63_07625 [Halopseudomonas nanhaiensis]|nr:hypothetical protein [Halopseudomonas nanhaiensis]UAW99821.1 hypothetical protein KEM63_07625 [Halopseudomonas nanhaiensis]
MSNDPKKPTEYDEMEEGAPEGAVNSENLEKVDAEKIKRNIDTDENEVPG